MAGPIAAFPGEALEANRQGHLTDAQRTGWIGVERAWSSNFRFAAVVFAAIGLLSLAGVGPVTAPLVRVLGGVGCLVAAGVLAYVSVVPGRRLERDLREGRVESVQGAVRRQRYGTGGGGAEMTRYSLEVGGRRFDCTPREYEAAPAAGFVRLYFLPRTRKVVNLEVLTDMPLPAGAMDHPAAALAGATRGMTSHDATERAEAAATIAALAGAAPSAGSPSHVASPDARPLAETIVGTWRSPLMSVTFSPDGSAAAAMVNGMSIAGRWSVTGDGRLRITGLGEDIVTDASVAGDVLRVVWDSTPISLQRSSC